MVQIKPIVLLVLLSMAMLSPIFILSAHGQPGNEVTIAVLRTPVNDTTLTPGSTFTLNVTIFNATSSVVPQGILGVQFQLSWNTGLLQPVNFTNDLATPNGAFSGADLVYGQQAGFYDSSATRIIHAPYTNATYYFVAAASDEGPMWGSGTMVEITFKVLSYGMTGLTLSNIDLLDGNQAELAYNTINSSFDNLVIPALQASIAPMSRSIMLGQNVNFSSVVAGGVPPYSYQWSSNGTIVPSANSAYWDFTPASAGSYNVQLNVTDSEAPPNSTSSGIAHITVTQPPTLTASISSSLTTIYAGQTANLVSAVGGGVPPYTYQWFDNGTLILGATFSTLNFSASSSETDVFALNVTDSYGSSTLSNSVTITVLPALTSPEIYIDPSRIVDVSMGPGSIFYVNITVANVTNVAQCSYNITYDPNVLTWIGFNFVETQGQYPTAVFTGNTTAGYAWIALYYSNPITVQSAPLTVMMFYVNSYGVTPLNLTNTMLIDQLGNPIVHNTFGGFFANEIRDVAVTNVVPSASWLYQNWTGTISVTVANLGTVTENFTASAWYNSTLIGSALIVNLAPNANMTVPITWDTAGVAEGTYTITGTASYVPYETYFNITNNVYVDGSVLVLTTVHDVAVTSIQPTASFILLGTVTPVQVTVANLGDVTEDFNVTAYYNGTAIDTMLVNSLAAGTNTTLTFNWNTTGLLEGNYTLSAFASYVQYEYNTTNNFLMGGQILLLNLIRDVAITNVQPFPQMLSPIYNVTMVEVYPNRVVTVNVTAANLGNLTETFDVTAWIDGNVSLGTQTISNLPPQNTTVLTFYWNPTGQQPSSKALHVVSANTTGVPFDFNTTNNYLTSPVRVMIKLFGDIDGDGKINLSDLVLLTRAYGSTPGSPLWNPEADINNNGRVDLSDLVTLATNYGKSY